MRGTREILSAAQAVKAKAALLSTDEKNRALREMADELEASAETSKRMRRTSRRRGGPSPT